MHLTNSIPSKLRAWGRRRRRTAAIALGLAAAGAVSLAAAQVSRTREFTPDDVRAILSELRGVDPSNYFIRLPAFQNGKLIGTNTYGTLPMVEVRRLASTLNVRLSENANVITVFDPGAGDDSGGGGDTSGGGGDDGGGPGSHVDSQSAGSILSERIDVLLQNINASRYQFLR